MQELRSSNPPVVTGICDPNKSRTRHHRSLKLGSKLKHLEVEVEVEVEVEASRNKKMSLKSKLNEMGPSTDSWGMGPSTDEMGPSTDSWGTPEMIPPR